MERIRCLEAIYDELAGSAVVTIMGAVAVELYSLGHRPNFFYLEHAMGLASSMGLGIALSQPQRKVVVLDGDGSVLMNLGGLTTMARYAPGNLTHLVFDNQSLLSVGGFPTATATGSDLAGMARAATRFWTASVTTSGLLQDGGGGRAGTRSGSPAGAGPCGSSWGRRRRPWRPGSAARGRRWPRPRPP